MAGAARAANMRTVIALQAVTNTIHITQIDRQSCTFEVEDEQKLEKTFAELGVQEFQLSAFRQTLAGLCPEQDVHDQVVDEDAFPIATTTPIPTVAAALEGLISVSAKFDGTCIPAAAGVQSGQ